jgi:hypothetical protein
VEIKTSKGSIVSDILSLDEYSPRVDVYTERSRLPAKEPAALVLSVQGAARLSTLMLPNFLRCTVADGSTQR